MTQQPYNIETLANLLPQKECYMYYLATTDEIKKHGQIGKAVRKAVATITFILLLLLCLNNTQEENRRITT